MAGCVDVGLDPTYLGFQTASYASATPQKRVRRFGQHTLPQRQRPSENIFSDGLCVVSGFICGCSARL
ncbi:hypothetical protein HMPREF9123_2112 [Neisseria bacilliformis ATCC BAA-1200]|uniref:Uncharacterized protein n=1 Tax=Neisseria bacilliformis ATCC BAA-1200 TaxID=888742 RepID=F2BEF6_9NEIS|nr:hypothetical protein HMPREF9123_2112 [Neisseria bacilliformis ATCC BAA-1200]